MSANNMLLDTNIRNFILIPLVAITVMVQILKHYLLPVGRECVSSILAKGEDNLTLEDIQKGQAIMRSRLLREKGGYIPLEAFYKRKAFLLNGEDCDGENNRDRRRNKKGNRKYKKKEDPPKKDGIITKGKQTPPPVMPPGATFNMFMRYLNIWLGHKISRVFSGYLILKIPFPIPATLNRLFQSGVELEQLDSSWMSSLSLYMFVMFGSGHFMKYLVGAKTRADRSRDAQDRFEGSYSAIKQNVRGRFNNEWEQLQIAEHVDLLDGVENAVVSGFA